jgi:glucuronosyltransferase
MLVCAFHGDQQANADRIIEMGIGGTLEIHKKLTAAEVRDAILEIITNGSYKKNITDLSQIIRDAPMTPQQSAVWWIEYVIRNKGAKHFNYLQKTIPFYQYHYLDVILSVVAVFALLLITVYGFTKLIVRLCKRLMNKKPKSD